MSNVLMVMQGREIPECMESIMALKIPKVVFRGYTEMNLSIEIPKFINDTNYENYLIVSDDTICNQDALTNVEYELNYHEVVTGWCRLSPTDQKVTLCSAPLKTPKVSVGSYSFMLRDQVIAQTKVFRTYFMGWALSGMTRELWLKVPFYPIMPRRLLRVKGGTKIVVGGWGSDYYASWRLQQLGQEIVAVPQSEIIHLATMRNSIMGQKSEIKYFLDE